MATRLKYGILGLAAIFTCHVDVSAQETNTNNQAIVTIIGDPVQTNTNTTNDFINTNPYAENTAPPDQPQIIQSNQNIEPTLENGFHMRFEVNSDQYVDHGGSLSNSSYYYSGGGGYIKVKKRSITVTERSFNVKKRIKSWLPEHKKRYHPHLCGRF